MAARIPDTTAPIHLGTIVDYEVVRFFSAPFEGPDLVWIAAADLLKAAYLPKPINERYLAAAEKLGRTIETPNGATIILPHTKASEMLNVLVDHGRAPKQILKEYAEEVSQAERVAVDYLTPEQRWRYLVAIHQRDQPDAPE